MSDCIHREIVARMAEISEPRKREGKPPSIRNPPLTPNLKKRLVRLFKPEADSVRYIFNLLPDFLSPDGTFPDHTNPPALILIIPDGGSIPFPIAGKFLPPKILIGMWKAKILTFRLCSPAVRVPKATVNENHRKIARKNKVRLPRITLVTNPVSKTRPPQSRANLLFRLSVPATDERHVLVPGFR